jgi:antitoxin (DNA-binding transcriptional repressor) of toxin-antitoxin stability system
MEFVSVRELRAASKAVWGALERDGRVVVTNNGKPTALMVDVDSSTLQDTLDALDQAEGMRLLARMRRAAAESGAATMTPAEIEAEIAAAREQLDAP